MRLTHDRKILIIKIVVFAFAFLTIIFPLQSSPSVEAKTAVMVVAFDRKDDKTQLYVQMTIPQQRADGSAKLLVVEVEGNDVADAFERLSVKIGLEIELAHCGIILIGEDMAKGGIIADLDYMLSSSMISPQTSVLNCGGSAKDFMQKLNDFSQTNGSGVFDVVNFSEDSINVRVISALRFLSENNLPSAASSLPVIDFEMQEFGGGSSGGSDSGGSSGSGGGSSGGGSGESKKSPTIKELNECIVYKNGKAVGKMSPLGTKGLSMFDTKSRNGYLEADNVVIGGKAVSYVPLQVNKKDAKLKAKFVDGAPVLTAEVNIALETETRFNISKAGIFASKDEVKEAIAKRIKEIVQSEIEDAINTGIELDADVLGIETAFYKQCNKEYKKYASKGDFVKNVQMEYKINVDVV